MQGLKEIVYSCVIALTILLTFNKLRGTLTHDRERARPMETPIASAGESVDPNLSLNWGLHQINAPRAWRRHTGSKNVIVAVIDTGCDPHHPALKANLWRNQGEAGWDKNGVTKLSNGIDDDDNGFVDDFHGWNFIERSGDITDGHGHGTHIAGIIGADGLNGLGSNGIAPHVSLMILKYYDTESGGMDNLLHSVAAIRYAVNMGADIINYSGGGVLRSQDEEAALRWAAEQGVLVVAAAGNEGLNSDFFHFYPADYGLPNIISIAAIDFHERLLRNSNYGLHTVHLAAPGKNIYSTLPTGKYGYMSGTSQATAFVSGVAALLIAGDPRLRDDPQSVIRHLIDYSSPRNSLRGKVRSGGVLDAGLALDGLEFEVTQSQ